MKRCLRVKAEDNVATLLEDAADEPVEVVGLAEVQELGMRGSIALGHKVAIAGIPAGCAIVKYGVTIGVATADIDTGEWVHLHNCRSLVDARSNTFDAATGAVTDTRYE
jgi:altronate dehydratase small subunit